MIVQALNLCPRSWKILLLLEEYKIEYKPQYLMPNTRLEFPIIGPYTSDLAYIFTNFNQFIKSQEEAQFYGIWLSIIDTALIPEIIMPIRHERIIKPIVFRQHSCLNTLMNKRGQLKKKLYEISEYLGNNQWLGPSYFSICDITLSTSIATMDYLGEITWHDAQLEHLYAWYLKIKSRAAFQIILKQKCHGMHAHNSFCKIDF